MSTAKIELNRFVCSADRYVTKRLPEFHVMLAALKQVPRTRAKHNASVGGDQTNSYDEVIQKETIYGVARARSITPDTERKERRNMRSHSRELYNRPQPLRGAHAGEVKCEPRLLKSP